MATYAKTKLSSSSYGKAIKVAAIATPGTVIHTAVSGSSDWDEIWLYCFNSDSVNVDLTLEWGGTSAPDNNIKCTVPPVSGLVLIVPGLLLQDGLALAAFASITNVLTIMGFVNRITA
jgi:hypothetical protein